VNRSLTHRSLDDFSATASVSRLINALGDGTLRLHFVDALLICKVDYFVRFGVLTAVTMDVALWKQLFLPGHRVRLFPFEINIYFF
jgi:hypothetical protein